MIVKKIKSALVLGLVIMSPAGASQELKFDDGTVIKSNGSGYSVAYQNQNFEFKPTGVVFKHEDTKEVVEEYVGIPSTGETKFSWAEVTFVPGGTSPAHFHNIGTEYYFITQGSKKAYTMVGDNKVPMPTGARIVINPNTIHHIKNESPKKDVKLLVLCTPAWTFQDHNLISQ